MKRETIISLPPQPTPYAVLGQPVHHSLSPVMQQAAFDELGIEARYFRIEVGEDKLAQAVADLRQVPFGGWNCTVPNKVRMLDLCDRLDDSARLFRAVNTVVNEDGRLVGHNTDGIGFSRAIKEAFGSGPEAFRILLLGAGGAGRAVATQALLENCPELILANRSGPRAYELEHQLQKELPGPATALRVIDWTEPELATALREIDLVVNATSAGLDPKAPPILSAELMPKNIAVFDSLYGPSTDRFRREVETAGARWADGRGMLLHQGAAAFSLWTGQAAPVEVMRTALEAAFSASRG